MDRRNFLKNSLLGAGALAVGGQDALAGNKKNKPVKLETRLETQGYITEPARQIPLVAQADVVIVGGGPAGVSAALSAARGGSSVILLERYTYLGGLWTGGNVLPVLNTMGVGPNKERTDAIKGIMTEITNRLFDIDMCHSPERPLPDPEATKYILAEMLHEAGVQVVYHSQACNVSTSGDRIDSVIIECKSGRVAIKGKVIIDCSGDGDIFYWAGESFVEQKHHIGVMWRVGNAQNVKRGEETPAKNVKLMHTRGQEDQDGLDVFNLSRLQFELRRYMWNTTQELRKEPGCEDAFMLDTPSQLGVRSTRILNSKFNVTMDGSMNYATYDDVIGMSGGSDAITYKGNTIPWDKRPIWQIPYRALVPQKNQNLLVAGRCFGFEKELTYDAREIGTCMVTGQAAGTAAAIAVNHRCAVSDVDIRLLQGKLKEQGVKLSY